MSRTKITHNHTISQVFVFVLLGVFAVLATMMVLLSAQLYRGIVDQTDQHSAERILSSYVANVVRSGDESGMVEIDTRDGIDMLVLGMDVDGERYETLIYCYEGTLRELFTSAEQEFEPDYGEIICNAQAFQPVMQNGLLEMSLTDDLGQQNTLYIALRCSQEAANE